MIALAIAPLTCETNGQSNMKTYKLICQPPELFITSPAPGVLVQAYTCYTRATGGELVSMHTHLTRSDTPDIGFIRHSTDNGRTWSEPVSYQTGTRQPAGMLRCYPRGAVCDPVTDRLIRIENRAILPTDYPLEWMQHGTVYYSVSRDGGRTWDFTEPIVQCGAEYNLEHPLPNIWRGRNGFMLGDITCRPLVLDDGTILVPCQISPVGPDGKYHSPGGGMTYTDAAVLRGRWRTDGRIDWELSQRVESDPRQSTRGMIEPTLGRLADGRLLMIMRGSNGYKLDLDYRLPGYRWSSISSDQGRTWTAPVPWMYDDSTVFFSPSSCSQLLEHSTGALFWIGNISPTNPRANGPRYPLVIGQVDRATGRLLRQTVTVIADREAGENAALTLSNFLAREDRESHEILVHLSRLMSHSPNDWTGDARLYRVKVVE